MNSISFQALTACAALSIGLSCRAQTLESTTEAALYCTMPSTTVHRPEMAMDGGDETFFQSAYGMSENDDFTVMFSRPLTLRGLRVTTGNEGDNLLTRGMVEVSSDGQTYTRAASFDAQGVASATMNANQNIAALRVKVNAGGGLSRFILREITLDSPTKISHLSWGTGRPFSNYAGFPDLKDWAAKADRQMTQSWPHTAAMLYSPGFITPNKVNVNYKSGPDVTPVAAAGGGEITVNVAWARAHPEDTGLTVHEVAHVIQSISAYDPVWLIEGIADYVRWVKFEPQNFVVRFNPATAKYSDSYRTTGAFLAWCELHYDSRLVTKLNHDARFGTFQIENFKRYTGKDVNTLWSEFVVAYKADPVGIITPALAPADRPRPLPVVTPNTSVEVDLSKAFNAIGIVRDGAPFPATGGFDAGGTAFSANALGTSVSAKNVSFGLGETGKNNVISANGAVVFLPREKFSSLWLLGAAVGGAQRAQEFVVLYTDGTRQTLAQNFSDWYSPQSFPGESRAARTESRNAFDGAKDLRPFSLYCYGFALNNTKTVQSLTLPTNQNVKIAGVSLAR